MDAQEKIKVARLSIVSNSVLTVGKLAAGISMNSISVISEAIHSGLDLIAAIIAFASVKESAKPADDQHRYGHGKFENLAAILEALLIFVAAGLIIKEAVSKLYGPTEIKSLGLGIVVMGVSAVVNLYVSARLMKVARATDSPALTADAWHLRTDVYTSVGVLVGIAAIKVTGYYIIDPLIAIGVALLILKAAFDLTRDSLGSILDVRLPDNEENAIREILQSHAGHYVEYRQLRTRKAGPQRYIDFILVVPRGKQIVTAHSLCDCIEKDIRQVIPRAEVVIHAEPCRPINGDCETCQVRLIYCISSDSAGQCHQCHECQGKNIDGQKK